MSVDYTQMGHTTKVGGTPLYEDEGGRAHAGTEFPTAIVKPNAGSYSNGYELCAALHGAANAAVGFLFQIDISYRHPRSNTPLDKATTFTAGDPIPVIRFEENEEYRLPASSFSGTKVDVCATAANGLIQNIQALVTTLGMAHVFILSKTVSSVDEIRAVYKGIRNVYVA